jgi:glycosyltransferase involved in cell wall biosynthesis
MGRIEPTRRFLAPDPEEPIERGPVPTFSIIIPAYQAAGFVAEAIESALAQTWEPHEIMLCDDGSTDDLHGAVEPFRGRIILLHRPHRGAGAARNAGLYAASGDFIVMLDADDVYEPDRLSALGELAAARPDLDILSTDAYLEHSGIRNGRFHESTPFAAGDQRLAILDRCFVAWPALRRARVIEVGGFDESGEIAPAEDWDLFARLILSGSKAGIVDQPLMRYRQHPASMTANRARALRSRVAFLEKARLHPSLSAEERHYLERYLVRARSRAVLFDAQLILAAGRRGFRSGRGTSRRLLALTSTSKASPTTRLTILAAAFVPAVAQRMLTWKEKRVARWRAKMR